MPSDPYRGNPRHPVHALLAETAYAGREATEEELEELRLDPADAALVRRAGREASFLHAGGDRGRAHSHALRRSQEIIAGLPEEKRDPTYLRDPNEGLEGLGPAELAERVPR
jgi:hypothetical protein